MTVQPMPAQPIQEGAPAAPTPTHTPVHTAPPLYHKRNMLETIFSAKAITIVVMFGVILFFAGAMVASLAKVTDKVDNDIDEINDSKESAFSQYKMGVFLMVFGSFLIVLFLLCGSVMSQNISTNVKLGFLIFCAIIIFCTTWIVLSYTSTLVSTGPSILE